MITNLCDLCKTLNLNPSKIILASDIYDWLLKSNWNCIMSNRLKDYIGKGGIVERKEVSE